jgi:hypothetical protein
MGGFFMPTQQAFSELEVKHSPSGSPMSWNWSGNKYNVPANKRLEIGSLTLAYYPAATATIGNCLIRGNDSMNSPLWNLEGLFVDKYKILRLTFPLALMVEAGGHVGANLGTLPGATGPDKGSVWLTACGWLVDA